MNIFSTIRADFKAAYDRDPAANGVSGMLAILLCYPGFKAILAHRFLHVVYHTLRLKLLSRVISQTVRFFTGVEIHPAAQIGPGFFIDHGHGVVIGETTIIGSNVTLYQGVTLGGTGKECGKRHPTLKDNVVVGAGAKILGNLTLGDSSKVGAGSVVVRDVPDHATVVGIPAVVVRHGNKSIDLDHSDLPDPLANRLKELRQEHQQLEQQLAETRKELAKYEKNKALSDHEYEVADSRFV
jgi:serine O-acetyltransferase